MSKTIPYQTIDISLLELNEGQLQGLPQNPRYIKGEEYDKLKRSIQASPEFLEARMLLVYPLANGHFIVIAGNMRLRACRELGFTELPCYIFPQETPIEKLCEFTIKDNASFGNWDFDILANWGTDIDLLGEWGAPVDFLKQGEWENLPQIEEEQKEPTLDKPVKITLTIPVEQKDMEDDIRELLKEALQDYDFITIS